MDYKLEDIVDITLLQELQDKLNVIYSFPSAIIDNGGKILTAVAWQDICTKFHRVHPECEKECIKSDKYIADHLHEANPAVSYQCPHGLIDNAAPIIIDGKHLGNFFTGQFFLEKPDLEFFKKQAEKYGFDEKDYLEAVEKVPIWSKEKLAQYLDFIKGFIEIIAGIGLKNLEEIRINKTLKETEERYRTLFEGAPDAIFLADPETGIIVDANHSASRLLGRAIEDIIGMRQEELHPPQLADYSKDTFNQHIKQSFTQGNTFPVEHVVLRADGTQVPIEVLGQMVFVNGKELLMGTFRNITDRKLAEEALKESEQQYRNLANSGMALIWTSGEDKLCNYFNQPWLNFTGRTLEQGMGNGWADGVHPDDFDECLRIYITAFDNHVSFDMDYRMRHHSGEYRWIKDMGTPNFNSKGEFIGYIGHCFDISEHKRAEEKIREKDMQFRKLSSNLPDLIFQFTRRLDGTYCVPIASDGIIYIFGCTPEDVIDDFTPIGRVIHPEDAERVIRDIEYSAEHLTYFTCEFRVQIPGKEIQWIYSRSTPEKLPDGSITWYGFNADITDRKQAEEKIHESEERLKLATASGLLGIWDWNVKDNVMVWDDRMFELYGVMQNTFPNNIDAWMNGLHPEDKQRAIEECNAALYEDKEFDTSFRVLHPDGKVLYLKANALVIKDNEGKPIRMIGSNADITERKQAEAKLREKEIMHSSMIAIISDVIGIIGTDGIMKYKSPNISKYFGWEPEDLVGTNGWETVHPDDLERIQKEFSIVLQENKSIRTVEYRYKCKDESYKWIELTACNLTSDPIIDGVLLNYYDITDRKLAEEALKESEIKFKSLVETAQELVWKCDVNACFTYLNPAWEKTHGYKIHEMIGRSFSEFQTKEIFERDVKEFSRHLAGGFVKEYETNHIAKDGTELTLLFNAVPLFAKDGTIVGTQGTAVDITERKRSEEALKESEDKLSSLFASMTEMVVMHELVFNEQGEAVNYRILDCNDAFTKTTGIKRENAIGKLATEVYQTVFPPYLEEYTRVGITGESLEFTTFFEPMDLHFAISVVSPKKNQFSTVTSNITDRKKAELELQSRNMEIEAQYEEYMQLNEVLRQTNYDLELAKDKAEQSEKLKTTFLQNMSHEIRTPLNGIMGFSTLLKDFDELTVHEKTEYINLIIGSSERLLGMIDDVLIISSLDSKIINADQSEFKLSELISDFNALYYTNTKSKGLKFSVNVPNDCSELFITTDKNKLYQIVTNLLNNALKFTNKGEIELGVIRYEKTLKLYVKDTGIGIKSDYIDKIYDRFWQYEAFTKDFYGGTGLGLAISSGLAYLLGIEISVESEFGVGTTFTLTLKQDSVKDIAIMPSKTEVQNKVQMDFHDLNILIVEDEETNFSYLNTLLRKVGAISDLARDGMEAIEMTEKKEYDLILMDLKMPVMDGFESTRQIRSKNKDVTIIAQSAYTQSDEKERALGAGCNDYIVKPIRIDDFYYVINQVTKRKSE